MKKILCSLALLGLCLGHKATAQTLILDDLVELDKMEQMQQDAYLVHRGWKFLTSETEGDSVVDVYWGFYNSRGHRISELAVRKETGQRQLLAYTTALRPAFDEARATLLAVPDIEKTGTSNTAGVMRSYYRDKWYDFTLRIDNEQNGLNYSVSIQRHGLTKGWTQKADGTLEPTWVRMPKFTPKQKRELDSAFAEVKATNERLRAEGLAQQKRLQQQKKPRR